MRFSVLVLWLVLAACGALVAFVGGPAKAPRTVAAASGVELLRNHRCHRAETKKVIVQGVEDNFSPAGEELSAIRPERRTRQALSWIHAPHYDSVLQDAVFTDSIPLPDRIASGLLVIGLRPNGDASSDTIGVGDLTTMTRAAAGWRHMSAALSALPRTAGWTINGPLHWIELKDMRLAPRVDLEPPADTPASLLALIRKERLPWLDVLVQDDTSVDFIGLAVCLAPVAGKGLTLSPPIIAPPSNTLALACRFNKDEAYVCDPYAGDTPCETALPVVCFRPEGRGLPPGHERKVARALWTGGSLALSDPVPANRFPRIEDVDRFCASRFGTAWRAATLHDGSAMQGLAGYGDPTTARSRAWVDVLEQPYATCWKH